MYLIGYDIGSSTIKVALVDADTRATLGVVHYPDQQEMDILSRQSGWAEQQPEVWWQDLCVATKRLLTQTGVSPAAIKGIGISYQMHGLVLLDKEQQVLRPAIIWCDSRAVAIGQTAIQEMGAAFCMENLLNSPGNFTASKLKWVKDNEPEIYNRIHKILLPGDFIAMRLTGEAATTITGLSEGIFWNFKERRIAHEVLDYYELDGSMLARIVPTFSIQGAVTKEAAEMTGLAMGTTVTYRAGDQPNNALTLNVLKPGEVAATSGTSGVVYGIVDKLLHDPRSRVNGFAHVNYERNFDRIGMLLCLNGAGIQYSWLKHQVGLSGRSYGDMSRMASTVPVGSDGLCVLPFGNGSERMLEDRELDAQISGLQFNRHTRAHLFRAALEGVAFSFVYGINILKEMGLGVDVIRVGNDNMFQSRIFSMTIATLLGNHIEVVETTGAVGAARAAGVAAGIYHTVEAAFGDTKPSVIFEPRLNFAQCTLAYNQWTSCLDRALLENPDSGRRNIAATRASNVRLERELTEKTQSLSALTFQKAEQDELLAEVKDSLLTLVKNNPSLKKEAAKIVQRIDQTIQQTENWHAFEGYFDGLNNDFFKRIKADYPDLSPQELKMCVYLKMNLSTKEIAQHLHISGRGVETRRYRLRRKLGVGAAVNLAAWLARF